MRLFEFPAAQHFCAPSPNILNRVSQVSLSAFHEGLPTNVHMLLEGSSHFEIHQVNSLRSVQRWLTFSVGHYRRSVEMLVPVSAPWAHVTLYYSSFFAANAIVGMFGGWLGQTKQGPRLVDVEHQTVGNQMLRVHRRVSSSAGFRGSHKLFWEQFYSSKTSLAAEAPASLKDALDPAGGDLSWQITERNNVNYDMHYGWAASALMFDTFNPGSLQSLTGPLKIQLEATEGLVKLALWFAKKLALPSYALSGCGFVGTRQQMQKRLVSQRPPSLAAQSALATLLET